MESRVRLKAKRVSWSSTLTRLRVRREIVTCPRVRVRVRVSDCTLRGTPCS